MRASLSAHLPPVLSTEARCGNFGLRPLIDMVSKAEPVSPRSLDPRIPRDLETIVLISIDKDPKRRYQSADEMSEDLQRFINDEPVLARIVGATSVTDSLP